MSPRFSFMNAKYTAAPNHREKRRNLALRQSSRQQPLDFLCLFLGYFGFAAMLAVSRRVSFLYDHIVYIVLLSANKQVIKSATNGIVTFMAKFKSFCNQSKLKFPGHPVNQLSDSINLNYWTLAHCGNAKPLVAMAKPRGVWWNAAFLVNLLPNPDSNRFASLLGNAAPPVRPVWVDFRSDLSDAFSRLIHILYSVFEFSAVSAQRTLLRHVQFTPNPSAMQYG